jgi:hypothetical protein
LSVGRSMRVELDCRVSVSFGKSFWTIRIGPTDGLWHWQTVRVATLDSLCGRDVSRGSVSLCRRSVVPIWTVCECDGWYVPPWRTVRGRPRRFG